MKRREFLKLGAVTGAAALLRWQRLHASFERSPTLRKFGPNQPLRLFGPDIPVATANTTRYPGVDYYEIAMRSFTDELYPGLETTLYGYGDTASSTFKHLGGAIVAQRDRPVRVSWTNELPDDHILPADTSVISPYITGEGNLVNRAAPHLHGGLVPWPSDGGPFHWFAPDGTRGASVLDWLPVDLEGTLNDDYWYPNNQSARMMWYHDHAVGITRLNAYAGIASGYLLKDAAEAVLMNDLGIHPARQIPLVIQDKVFEEDGSLWYPNEYDTQFFALQRGFLLSGVPSPSLVPEFWGDTMLVNGTVFPTLTVYPRKYRFQILNACNTRFMNLQLFFSDGQRFPDSAEPAYAKPGPPMLQIGTEGGFLDGTAVPQGIVVQSVRGGAGILLAPAERADIIVDFSKVKPGRSLILHNDAPVPFPGGTPLADFHSGNRSLADPPEPGYGPNTRTLLQFVVADPDTAPAAVPADEPTNPGWALPPSPAAALNPPVRDLAIYETFDGYGRLAQNLGPLSGPLAYTDAPSETVQAGSHEIWRLFNITADTHPIHFHYFNVRVLSRQAINRWFHLTGKPAPPDANELGWKETVRANPGECVTLLVELPPVPQVNVPITNPQTHAVETLTVQIPDSPRTGGHEYVWHCHILEHEEHDMMRPLIVVP